MVWLILGLTVFLGIHLLPTFSSLRSALIESFGPSKYQTLFALSSLTGLILIVVGMIYSNNAHAWTPPAWGPSLNAALMLLAITLMAAANMKTNVKRYTRHPMLWGVFLWAVGHMLSNSEWDVLILCGSFGIYALIAMFSANLRGARKAKEKFPLKNDFIVLAAGATAYVAFIFLHPYLFGVAVITASTNLVPF